MQRTITKKKRKKERKNKRSTHINAELCGRDVAACDTGIGPSQAFVCALCGHACYVVALAVLMLLLTRWCVLAGRDLLPCVSCIAMRISPAIGHRCIPSLDGPQVSARRHRHVLGSRHVRFARFGRRQPKANASGRRTRLDSRHAAFAHKASKTVLSIHQEVTEAVRQRTASLEMEVQLAQTEAPARQHAATAVLPYRILPAS